MTKPIENPITIIQANYDIAFTGVLPNADSRMRYIQGKINELYLRAAAIANADQRTLYLQTFADKTAQLQ